MTRRAAWTAVAVLAALACGAVLSVPRVAHATIVERVVAVIGERPILWSDVLKRAAAARIQIRAQTPDPNVVSVQEESLYRELLDRMIDDRLEQQQADKAHITVTPEEVDRGIENIAAQAQASGQAHGRSLTVADVLEEIKRRGLTEQDFRDEIRRQILEGKLIELRVRPRVRVTDQDARAAYQHTVDELKAQSPVDVRVLALRVSPQSTQEQARARMALAEDLVRQVRAGGDFCDLVTKYSDDVSTRSACGSHGPQPMANLLPAIQDAVKATKNGAVSDPVAVRTPAEDVIIIAMPLGQGKIPSFDEVKGEMMQKALTEGLERARKQWLTELRGNIYVDVRL
ncbi:MAG: SurA N-terminal domain-containing protein [Polyangiaceae bacterium]